MMTSTLSDCGDASAALCDHAEGVCAFLAEYSATLFASGATCIRIEKNVRRMALVLGFDVEMSVFPRHIHLTVRGRGDGELCTSVARIPAMPISYTVNTDLSRLSWDMADGKVSYAEAREAFAEILRPRAASRWTLLLLVSIANASFCRLFGGDAAAMAVVFIATAAGFLIRQMMCERGIDFRLTALVCSFVSGVLASAGYLFSLGDTPELALGTSALYLVPGIPFLNSFSDFLYQHYICAFGRLMHAVVITCCLSAGLLAAMMVMRIAMF